MSEESVNLFEEASSSKADTELVVRAAVYPFPFDAPEEKFAADRGKASPVRGSEGPVEDVPKTEACTEADVQDKDVDAVGGVD